MIPFYIEGKEIAVILSVNSDFSAGETPEELKVFSAPGVEPVPDQSKGRVLIVDDSMMSRMILKNILTKDGYAVVGEAPDGEEGVKRFEELHPDLVTLDITMPRMDGLEALTHILASDPDAKVVMITAAGQQDKLIQALKTGAKRFINKPFNEEEILRNIEEII
ncbi:MAG: response regulator [Lachnospiraceae bacterium]|nr:response regulator [Lachnospiraceae bacterium]